MWMNVVNVLLSGAIFGGLQAVFAVNVPSETRALFEERSIFDRDDVVARLGRIWPFATLVLGFGILVLTGLPLISIQIAVLMLCLAPQIRRFRGARLQRRRTTWSERVRLVTILFLNVVVDGIALGYVR